MTTKKGNRILDHIHSVTGPLAKKSKTFDGKKKCVLFSGPRDEDVWLFFSSYKNDSFLLSLLFLLEVF